LRTVVNVEGDMVGCLVVQKFSGIKDRDKMMHESRKA